MVDSSDDVCDDGNGSVISSVLTSTALTQGITYYIEWDDHWSQDSFDFNYTLHVPTNCIPSDSLNNVLNSGSYHVTGEVLFGGSIMSNANVLLTSDDEISLEPGFTMDANSVLELSMANCSNN